MNARVLNFAPVATPTEERLLSVEEIIADIGGDRPLSRSWVFRNVPGKVTLGHRTKRFRESVYRAWRRSRRA